MASIVYVKNLKYFILHYLVQERQINQFDFSRQRVVKRQADFGHVSLHPLESHHVRVSSFPAKLNRSEEENSRIFFVVARVLVAHRFEVRWQRHGFEGGHLGDLVHPDGRQEEPVLQDDGSVGIACP